MAIFRPEIKSGSSNFYGICEISINEFKDRSSEFDWADIFIDVIVNQKGSEYTRNLKIAGSLDKNPDGTISGGSVLKRMYVFFDAIGCKAGLNVKGEWETENGEPIDDISEYLNKNFVEVTIPDAGLSYDYLAYIYKEKPKKEGDRAWTRVYHKIYKNQEANVSKLQDDVNWLKGKGVIKEATEVTPQTGNTLEGSGLASL